MVGGGGGQRDTELAGGFGQALSEGGFAGGGTGVDQYGGMGAGGGGVGGVAGEFGFDAGEGLAAGVVLEEEREQLVRLAPMGVGVGADEVAPASGAGAFRQPQSQAGFRMVAAPGGEVGEQVVDAEVVAEAWREGDPSGVGGPPAEVGGLDAGVDGQQGGSCRTEGVVLGCRAGLDQRPEGVEDVLLVKGTQTALGGAKGGEGESRDLVGGQDTVFVDHARQPHIAGGQTLGEWCHVYSAGARPRPGSGGGGTGGVAGAGAGSGPREGGHTGTTNKGRRDGG